MKNIALSLILAVSAAPVLAQDAALRRLEDEGLRERLGRAGRRTVEADFTVERCYSKLKDLLECLRS